MPRKAPSPRETAIQAAVVDHWRLLKKPHTLVAAIPNAFAHGQPGLTKGLVDLICIGPRVPGHVGFVELKRDYDSLVSEDQEAFLDLCDLLGIAWRLCVGRDEPIDLLEAWGLVKLSNRQASAA